MKKSPIDLIVAATPDGEIGYDNTIPWKLKGDLQRFKRLTMGNFVLIGRNTFNSLSNGLPGRSLVVISSILAGPRGKNGMSAYRMAVEGGFKGNQKQFIEYLQTGSIAQMATRPHYAMDLTEALLDIGHFGHDEGADDKKIFIAGGARLYEEALDLADQGLIDLTVHLTTVYKDPHTPGYDTKIKNFDLLDKFDIIGHPEEVYDEVFKNPEPQILDPGGWYWPDRLKPHLESRTLSHTYTTLRNK